MEAPVPFQPAATQIVAAVHEIADIDSDGADSGNQSVPPSVVDSRSEPSSAPELEVVTRAVQSEVVTHEMPTPALIVDGTVCAPQVFPASVVTKTTPLPSLPWATA
jgi:hypothetical protein